MLALSFLVVAVVLSMLLFAVGLFLQGYLYQQPAEKLPLRALAAGTILSIFLCFWAMVNTRAEGENKYGTFFEFNPTTAKSFTEFEAVRRYPRNPESDKEKSVPHKRGTIGTAIEFVEVDSGKPFRLNDSSYLTIGLIVPEVAGGKKIRFNTEIKDGTTYATQERRFTEEGGSRYIDYGTLGTMYSPSRAALFGALFLNMLLFVVWFAVYWPLMQFEFGHAVGLALVSGLITMLALMPVLFRVNKPKPEAPAPAAVTARADLPTHHVRLELHA